MSSTKWQHFFELSRIIKRIFIEKIPFFMQNSKYTHFSSLTTNVPLRPKPNRIQCKTAAAQTRSRHWLRATSRTSFRRNRKRSKKSLRSFQVIFFCLTILFFSNTICSNVDKLYASGKIDQLGSICKIDTSLMNSWAGVDADISRWSNFIFPQHFLIHH